MKFLKYLLALTLMVGASAAQADNWPSKPIRWIVPYTAGGGTDLMARVLAAHLEKKLGQRIVVENRPGGSTVTGTAVLAQAEPDGYTIGMVFDSLAINAVLGTQTPYDPEKDFAPIINLAYVPLIFIVNTKEVPMKTLPEVVAYAKAHPEWLTFGTLGPGSPHEIGFDWFKSMAGIKAVVVPYKGVNPAMQDTIAGQIKAMFLGVAVADQYIAEGKLRPLAVTSAKRLESAPDVPTIAELGYPDYNYVTFYGLAAPKNTPQPIIERLNKEINEAFKDPDVRKKLEPIGAILVGGTSKEFGDYLAANMIKFRKIMKPTAQAN
ncbi:tripartite tricarboxylate transporter substrate binding protein [Pseudolabrys taiwanensis]|uniref:Tripartite tricarboxylate transporter substrate binding protein n=1 Tax=Pseudolabrys taiwanensis TaxID=331696 RepID=A0A345ZUX2_9HYPH|nr:tripartite tricarboxylate transporter substrate binding protein [Pseudolabrys taiwanensis]AXK80719.1 tripartite tricarboxylate transporter substrate binding protein [Pseudolabrys taiwanensis]